MCMPARVRCKLADGRRGGVAWRGVVCAGRVFRPLVQMHFAAVLQVVVHLIRQRAGLVAARVALDCSNELQKLTGQNRGERE